jgi:hypothetical protein
MVWWYGSRCLNLEQAFLMTADSLDKTVSTEDMIKALSAIKSLKAYPDVEKRQLLKKWFQTSHLNKFQMHLKNN